MVPGRNKQARLPAEHLGGALLQAIDRRIFKKHVVANLGFRHRPAHCR